MNTLENNVSLIYILLIYLFSQYNLMPTKQNASII